MSQAFDILIVGGGVVGLTAALAMADRGFSVAVIDATSLRPETDTIDPRVYAINLASEDLFQQLGIWQQLNKERVSPYRSMHVWDAASKAHIDFDTRMVIAPQLGHIVEEAVLKEALLQQARKQAIALFPDSKVETIKQGDDSILVSSNDSRWQGRLLMVADGANSVCRQLLEVPLTSWPYHQQAIVALVDTEKSHQQTAYQVFNPDGPLAFLPLTDEKRCSIVWSTTAVRAKWLMSLPEDEFNRELTCAFAGKLGQASLYGKRHCFPLLMRHAKKYTGKHWLLLGDAAHTIHPLAGLGLNVGLADVASWLSSLEQAGNKLSAKALGSYQRQRKYAVWQVIALMEGLKTLFLNPLLPVVTLRGLGLQICDRLKPLKRKFIEHAAGKSIRF
ncbi:MULTISPECIES: UbiH/UbiF/VisC/COQ6 family ubiquinone biosynthesis hydroxylase [unclassified Legionella]|uniref:UbiH/UbiF/VisC/COQ6 family ubiquinone biosynthesis hydroxylase n=1 Tax=unclassified Legionella TaxID=2622702 RepID=UPI001054AFF2|nr:MULTISPECIES: UbiH/UbiF/VisC/COQ6 family ubiquinone biosynthesis hydroxylase [unclassified Legionella]MDI9818973.1 UbiH/UbiF/VisC/COQ6 family ubiquinone biosynthesis hydroxylase [Legionella sp. PL877]